MKPLPYLRRQAFRAVNDDTFWRPFAIVGLMAVIFFMLSGCATVSEDIEFIERTAAASATYSPNLPQMVFRVDDPDRFCKQLGASAEVGGVIFGCAEWRGRFVPGFCSIFVGKDAPEWTLAHERAHCKYGAWHR